MSFAAPKTTIEENDTIILYLTIQSSHAIVVTPLIKNRNGEMVENVHQTSYGALKVKDLIGKKYGSKVSSFKFIIMFWCSELISCFYVWNLG